MTHTPELTPTDLPLADLPTTDLSDLYPDAPVFAPVFREFGGRPRFTGRAVTLRVHENNPLVRELLGTPGEGRVLVVDGGGSLNCALLGGQLGELAEQGGWAGVIVNGCVRDTAELQGLNVGIRALAVHPRRSGKVAAGERDVPVTFAGVTVNPGDLISADEDGILILPPHAHDPA
ncbi:putative 4-hydroxy-4-methyl-2-oxoglutarate aldolase [Deinococcus seoulensis]|uniref:4-hydroxy-4-methyl-2-oxoglutarate aldolase n=1 Tax=Deinococcus seoulensis TaxID=1837379 RepID=A0ABQ2RRT9_9DEIO|nr:ribonuclease E activity regulator RraA [Deinococcus seoulensis]GGR51746.1 putative 4-hydroxy-4-methyl-2-oxoglutarate aldolase [Deinococcus seoulensis]